MSAAARELALREHDLERVAYTSALEEAAGGAAVRDELLREVGAAAADVGVSDTREVAEALRGRAWPVAPPRSTRRLRVRSPSFARFRSGRG